MSHPSCMLLGVTRRYRSGRRLAQRLAARDGGDRCHFCLELFAVGGVQPTIDHLVPLAAGGSNALTNLVLACPSCNGRKGQRSAEDFVQSAYVLKRRQMNADRERRLARPTYSHSGLRFGDGGAWACRSCGGSGSQAERPNLRPCEPAL